MARRDGNWCCGSSQQTGRARTVNAHKQQKTVVLCDLRGSQCCARCSATIANDETSLGAISISFGKLKLLLLAAGRTVCLPSFARFSRELGAIKGDNFII